MRFLLTVYEPLDASSGNQNAPQELARMWLDDTQTSFHVVTQLGEGFSTCQVGLPSSETMGQANPEATRYGQQLGVPSIGWLPRPTSGLRQRAHVVVKAGAFTVFEGRVTTVFPGPGGWPSGFLAAGYGVSATNDNYYTSASTANTTSGVALQTILQAAAPLIVVAPADRFVDPGIALRLADFTNMYPSQVISQIGKMGASGSFYDFSVYEQRVATFKQRITPTVPDYLVPWDARVQQAQLISDRMASQVDMRYEDITSPGSMLVESQTNPYFFAQNGWHHTEFIQGGKMTKDAANAYVAALLDLFAAPEFSATIIRNSAPLRDDAPLPISMGVETWSGQVRPPWLVRSGQWLQLSADAATPANVIEAGPHIIQRTEWISHGQLTITVGTAIQYWVHVLATIGNHLQSVRAKLNPNTGGPA